MLALRCTLVARATTLLSRVASRALRADKRCRCEGRPSSAYVRAERCQDDSLVQVIEWSMQRRAVRTRGCTPRPRTGYAVCGASDRPRGPSAQPMDRCSQRENTWKYCNQSTSPRALWCVSVRELASWWLEEGRVQVTDRRRLCTLCLIVPTRRIGRP